MSVSYDHLHACIFIIKHPCVDVANIVWCHLWDLMLRIIQQWKYPACGSYIKDTSVKVVTCVNNPLYGIGGKVYMPYVYVAM